MTDLSEQAVEELGEKILKAKADGTKVKITAGGKTVEAMVEAMVQAAERIPTLFGGDARTKLKALVARIENLNEDKAGIAADLKEVFAEAKGEGFDTKILRKVIALRAQDAAKRAEVDALVELYMDAVGD